MSAPPTTAAAPKGIPTIPPLPGKGARNRTPALTKGGDNADVLPEAFQYLRSSPTGTVSCREPGADCRAGVDRDTGHALIGDIVCRTTASRKAKKGDCGHLAAARLT